MVDGAVQQPPYAGVQRLIGWARENWADVDGRCLLAGIDIRSLPFGRALNIIAALAVDDATPVVTVETRKGIEVYDRRRVRGEVLAAMNGADDRAGGAAQPAVTRRQAPAERWDRETWGLLPEHQAGLRAAMGFAAGLGG